MQIKDNDRLYLNGVSGKFEGALKIKFFRRFRDFRVGDSWYVGRDRWDALVFIPSKGIRVFGIGLFEVHPDGGPFTMGYKYHIEDISGNNIYSSPFCEEEVAPLPGEVTDHIIQYKFKNYPKGIDIKVGQRFNFCMWLSISRCYYSETGGAYHELENTDKDIFELKDSNFCTNSTRVERGIIPGIIYSL